MSREMKDSGIEWIGEIPAHWMIMPIQRAFDEVNNPNRDNSESNALSFKYGTIVKKKEVGSVEELQETYQNYNVVLPETIMLNGLNLSFDFITQRVAQVKEKGIITSTYIAMFPKTLVNSNYSCYLLKSFDNCKAFHNMGRGLRSILSYNELKKYKIVLPSVIDQQRIADFLDQQCAAIDQVIENTKASIEEYKAYKQSVITEAVTKGLNPNAPMKDSGVEWIGEMPEHWNLIKLKYVTNLNQQTLGEDTQNEYKFRYVEIGAVTMENGIEKYEEMLFVDAPSRARRIVKKGDIIVSTVRTYLKAITSISDDENVVVSTGFAVLSPTKVSSKYLEYYFKCNHFNETIVANSVGISYPAINASKIVDFKIIIPDEIEQQTIANYLNQKCIEIDKLISQKQQIISDLETYKKSLIYEYVTGKKAV